MSLVCIKKVQTYIYIAEKLMPDNMLLKRERNIIFYGAFQYRAILELKVRKPTANALTIANLVKIVVFIWLCIYKSLCTSFYVKSL